MDKTALLTARIIDFAINQVNPDASERDQLQKMDLVLWKTAGEIGLFGLFIEEKYGGQGLDIKTGMELFENFALNCEDNGFTFSIAAQLFSCILPLWKYGSEDQKQSYLPSLIDGTSIAAHAITETASGSDVFQMNATAAPQGEHWLIHAEKNYCTSGSIADIIFLYAISDHAKRTLGGSTLFLLEKINQQFSSAPRQDKLGLRTAQMSDILVPNISIHGLQAIGGIGGGYPIFQYAMIWERIGMSVMHLGMLDRLFTMSIHSLKEKKSNSFDVARYQSITHKLAIIKTEIEATHHLCYHVIKEFASGKNVYALASMIKLKSSELLKSSAIDLLHLQGAKGLLIPNQYERILRDATCATLYSGTSEIQKNIIASHLKLI